MKKWEMLKKAYDNYLKGTKIYSTSGNGQIGMLNGNYIINSYGSVEDSSSFLIYNSTKDFGVWAEIITEEIYKELRVKLNGANKFALIRYNKIITTKSNSVMDEFSHSDIEAIYNEIKSLK